MEPQQRADFERLYRRHRAEIFRYLLRELGNPADADDATQEAFLNAFGAIERNGPPAHARPWLYAIADNLRRRWYRRRPTRRIDPLEPEHEQAQPQSDVAFADIAAALDALPRRQAQVLVGRDVAGLSYAEIADRLDLTPNAVQMLLFRARTRFRAVVGAQGRGAFAWLPVWRLAGLFGQGGAAPVARVAALACTAAMGFVLAGGGPAAAHRARPTTPAPAHRAAGAGTPLVQGAPTVASTRVAVAPPQTRTAAPGEAAPVAAGARTTDPRSRAATGDAPRAAPTASVPHASPVETVRETLDPSRVLTVVTAPVTTVGAAAPPLPAQPSSLPAVTVPGVPMLSVPSVGK